MKEIRSDFENFVSKAVRELQPSSTTFRSSSTEVVDWLDNVDPPSKEEIDAKIVELKAEYDANQYQRDRQYPQLGEQLDLLFHDMTSGKGTKSGEWYKAIAKVKADNPKG